MSKTRRWFGGRLYKAIVLIAFVAGLALLGASWSVYADRHCLTLSSPSFCARALWSMAAGGLIAVGAIVALWVRATRKRRT